MDITELHFIRQIHYQNPLVFVMIQIFTILNQPEEFHTCLIFNEIAKTESLCISNKMVVIVCKNIDNICIGIETFRRSPVQTQTFQILLSNSIIFSEYFVEITY